LTRIIRAKPPIYDEIAEVFPVRTTHGVIFAWGDTIFNPDGVRIEPFLLAHEAIHCRRQGADVLGWWRSYLFDPEFRLREETAAHKAEFWHRCRGIGSMQRDRILWETAKRLSAPLYRHGISPEDARRLLRAS